MKTKLEVYKKLKNDAVKEILEFRAKNSGASPDMVKEFQTALKDRELLMMISAEIVDFCRDHPITDDNECAMTATTRLIIKQWVKAEKVYKEQFKVEKTDDKT